MWDVWMWDLDYKESWALKNLCFWTVVLEKTLESPLDCSRSSHSILKEISPGCSLEGLTLKLNTLATWCEELTHLKRPWCWERLRAGGKGDDRGWDGWMASLTQWTWVWVNSRSGLDWETELNWIDCHYCLTGPYLDFFNFYLLDMHVFHFILAINVLIFILNVTLNIWLNIFILWSLRLYNFVLEH